MGEILFRGKIKYNGSHLFCGDWVEGSLVIKTHGYFIYVIEEDEFGNIVREFEVEVIPETIGQFTGLTDKNGVKIFEGDVVAGGNVLCNGGFNIINDKCTVIFESGMFKCGSMSLITFSNRCVVIGNIHNNTELLNE